MVMNLKGTKTEKNLQAAFAGESQARNKYTYYASAYLNGDVMKNEDLLCFPGKEGRF